MSDTQYQPILELGFYHPTERFLAVQEHIAVMDTSKTVPGGDGELVALFGPSLCGGATAEEKAKSLRQAHLFIAAPDLLTALKEVTHRFEDLLGPEGHSNGELDGDRPAIAKAHAAIAAAMKGER